MSCCLFDTILWLFSVTNHFLAVYFFKNFLLLNLGGPGSTPYNNVYITEEISKHQEQDNESISSTSSNTFSDTGSTVSTASTEEIRDDNDLTITNPSHVQEQTVRPTENLERGSRELSDDGDNAGNTVEEDSERNETSEGQATRYIFLSATYTILTGD